METKPESSEVEEQVTEEATNTEEEKVTSPAEEPTVPLHVHTALRSRAQTAEIEAAELRGKVSIMQQQQVKQTPPAVSPIAEYIAQQKAEGVEDDDIVINAPLYQKQRVYDAQVANETAANTAANDRAVAQATSTRAAMQVHTDWQEVIDKGQSLLSKGQHLDVISAGKDFGELAYAKCKAAIERNKPEPEPKAEPAPKKEPSEQTGDEKPKDGEKSKEEVKSQEEILANASPAAAKAFKL